MRRPNALKTHCSSIKSDFCLYLCYQKHYFEVFESSSKFYNEIWRRLYLGQSEEKVKHKLLDFALWVMVLIAWFILIGLCANYRLELIIRQEK